jgi:hypothetical protein
MRTIPLVNSDLVALVDDADYDYLSQFRWYRRPSGNEMIYAQRFNGKQNIPMHREILRAPPEYDVDHVDRDSLNNQRSNLRLATESQNMGNQRKQIVPRTSKYKGVYWNRTKRHWNAKIEINDHTISLGLFPTQHAAALVYNAAALQYFDEFALLNELPPEPDPDDTPYLVHIPASCFRGVYWHKKNAIWYAAIKAGGHKTHLGCFDSEEAAALAYDIAARKLHGSEAKLNFP